MLGKSQTQEDSITFPFTWMGIEEGLERRMGLLERGREGGKEGGE